MKRLMNMLGIGLLATAAALGADAPGSVVVLDENFAEYPPGVFFSVVGAHAEYHYLPETAPRGAWAVSTYRSDPASQRAWKVMDSDGQRVITQTTANKWKETHPMLVAGNSAWGDYEVELRFAPEAGKGRSGLVFRCRNDRCHYFFGVEGPNAVLKLVRDGKAFREPHEETLAETPCAWKAGEYLTAKVRVEGKAIRAALNDSAALEAVNDVYMQGGIGLTSDMPTRFASVVVTMSPEAKAAMETRVHERDAEEKALQARNPKPVVWKKVSTDGFGVGRNLRFGDLDGDGQIDVLVGQVVHHGPKDTRSELSCLTALTFDGKKLWQIGEPDLWKNELTNDVAFQIHDLDGDGRNEAVYCMNQTLIVADGATGKTKYGSPTPEMPANTKAPYKNSSRIWGDALCFCDLRGTDRPADLLLKDRYQSFWAMDDKLNVLWKAQCNTGHYPYVADIDGDGKDEVAMGYSMFDHNGKLLWSLDDTLQDHADGVAVVPLLPDDKPRYLCAGSDEGMILADLQGNVLKHHFLGHVQNPGIADFRPDLPGLETITVNFWGNQGIIHCFDAQGEVYHEFEPFQHGSLCLPINWTGEPGEFVVLSANTDDGGMVDGWGRRVVRFPADAHPDMCYAVLDVTGDCRDEVIVWDPYELWVYTQDDSPKSGKLFKPKRSPLYNESNYRATVSVPAWQEK